MYQPHTVLITGCAGFIGSNVTVYLVQKYPAIRFIGLDALFYCGDVRNFSEIKDSPNFTFIHADFTEMDKMNEIFSHYKPDTVLHYGASTDVTRSFVDSLEFTRNNVVGTHVLLEVTRQQGCVRKFVLISTDEIYGSKQSISVEDTSADPKNPYAASKTAAEFIAKSYYYSFKLPLIITRGNNVYGPRQYPEKVIPRFILRLLSGQKCQIQGSGLQKRSFLHVDDTCRAFETILFQGIIGEVYNVGTPHEITILDLAKRLINILKPEELVEDWIEFIEDRNFQDLRYFISSEKLNNLGWHQEIDFTTGLQQTVDWYRPRVNQWVV